MQIALYTHDASAIGEYEPRAARWTIAHPRFAHKTDAAWQPRTFKLDSTTDYDQRQMAKITVAHVKDGKKMLKIETPKSTSDIELLLEATKTAKLAHRTKHYAHTTDISYDQNRELTIKSDTTRAGKTLAAIDAALTRQRRSHLAVEVPEHKMKLFVAPFEQQKSAQLTYSNDHGIAHDTEGAYGQSKLSIKSKTLRHGATVADIMANIERPRSEFKLDSALFNAHGRYEQVSAK